MNILEKIVEKKRLEITENRINRPIQELQNSSLFSRQIISFRNALSQPAGTGIIAEFKRKSPSKGTINADASVADVTTAYVQHGASAISILTDKEFFGGSNEDLSLARNNSVPILRKDFIIDEYQIVEARSIGADVILLIAACLKPEEVKKLAGFAKQLGLETLLEVHNEGELDHICDECDVVGVNNRDLKTFNVDINLSLKLANKIPGDKIKISESGITDTDTIFRLREAGFKGFLVGENFMKQNDPGEAFASFVKHLKPVHR